jgi:peptide/nickel transport system permease protein
MIRFTLRRLGAGLVLLAVIPTLAFWLMNARAGNVARDVLGQSAAPEQVDQLNAQLGRDDPLLEQYLSWAGKVLTGDFGASWYTSEPVLGAVLQRLPVTVSLVLGTTLVAAILAVAGGVAAAVYRGWVDRVVQIVAILGFALPGFWVALMLALIFAVRLGLFPATGYTPLLTSPAGWLHSLTLPIASLAVGAVASAAQQIRGAVIDTLGKDWVRTLRSRGLSSRRVLFVHVLRNASVSGLTVLALQFVGLLGGAVFVERIFALPGIGQVLSTSTAQGDIPMVLGVLIATTVIVVLVNLLIDLGVASLNPKARTS